MPQSKLPHCQPCGMDDDAYGTRAIPLMLFSSHFVLWFRHKEHGNIGSRIVSILVSVTLYLLFRSSILDFVEILRLARRHVYGSTLNFVSLKLHSGFKKTRTSWYKRLKWPYRFFFVYPFGGYKLFRKILPHNSREQANNNVKVRETFEGIPLSLKVRSEGSSLRSFYLLHALPLEPACLWLGAGLNN